MGERQAGVNDGMGERESLALVNGYGPGRLHGILAEHTLLHLLNLLGLLVKLIAVVLPFLWRHLNGVAPVLGLYDKPLGADCRHAANHAVVIAFLG